jgi:hypothetical protein
LSDYPSLEIELEPELHDARRRPCRQ